MIRRLAVVVALVGVLGSVALHGAGAADAGRSDGTTVTPPSAPVDSADVPPWEPSAVEWTEVCPGVEAGYLDVPIDYAHPDDGGLRIYLTRRLANEPDGVSARYW